MQKYVIFDVDGTLNQTKLYAVSVYQQALKKRNIQKCEEEIIACIGMCPQDIVRELLGEVSEEETKIWRKEIKEAEYNLVKINAKAFPGIRETITELRKRGFKTAICSNAYPNHIKAVLKAIGLEKHFDIIASLEMGNSKAEVLQGLLQSVTCDWACLVGDRKFDIQAARENQIPIIGCLYGYAPEEIRDADCVVQQPVEIIQMVEKLLEDQKR